MPTNNNPPRQVTIIEIEGPIAANGDTQNNDNTRRCEYQVIDLETENEVARLPSPSQAHGRAFDYALRRIATLIVPHDILAAMQNEEDARERDLAQEWATGLPF